MGTRRLVVFMLVSAWGWSLLAQQAPAPEIPSSETDPEYGQQPLTPGQQRDKEIRQFDPLDQSDNQNKERERAAQDAAQRSGQEQPPLPGSIAAMERDTAGRPSPNVTSDDDEPVQEYSGPAVLSRSYSLNRPMIPEQLKWAETLGFNFIYDTGIEKIAGTDGSVNTSALIGTQLTWSLVGRHYFKRDQIGISYTGNFTRYSGSGGFNGANNNIAIDYTHLLTRRLSLNLTETGSILSQNYILNNPYLGPNATIANISLGSSPNIQITDDGTKQLSTQADVTWQKSARLSFDAGVTYFGIVRDGPGLLGVSGQQERGDVNYRLTRKMTVGSYYTYNYYFYEHGSGTSDTNTIGAILSYAFARSMQLRLRAGISGIETLGIQPVQIAPSIAALLGQTSGVIEAYSKTDTSDISGQLIKDFHNGRTATIAFAHGASPGNGVFQTSVQESISVRFATRFLRIYTFQTSFGRDTLTAVAQALSKYQSDYGSISLSRKLPRGAIMNISAEFRHFDVAEITTVRNQLRVSSGLTWGPPGGRIWPF